MYESNYKCNAKLMLHEKRIFHANHLYLSNSHFFFFYNFHNANNIFNINKKHVFLHKLHSEYYLFFNINVVFEF